MFFRVTPQHWSATTISNAQRHSIQLARLQRQISSGIRLEKPSDGPAEMAALLSNKELVGRFDADLQNMVIARANLNQSVTQLLSAKEGLTRAKSLALDGVQSVEKEALALEVDGILNELITIANSTDGVNPLFAGTAGGRPFEIIDSNRDGEVEAVRYVGTDQRSSIVVGNDTSVDVFYPGSEVFQARGRGPTLFVGTTGARAGIGTDTQVQNAQLTVRHVSTTYSGASGLAPAADSAEKDTIIGRHELKIDGVNGTIQLDDGPRISFDGSETSLRVATSDGAEAYVDTTALVPGFSGTIEINASGTLSLDGGTTEIAIDFTQNQVWSDPTTGAITHIDTTNVKQAGVDQVEYGDTADVFSALIQLRNDLRNTRNLTPTEWEAAMQRRIGDLERVHDHILRIVGEQSVTLENLDAMQTRTEDHRLELLRTIGELESTDMVEAITNLQAEQSLLQFTYATSAKLMNELDILDYIR